MVKYKLGVFDKKNEGREINLKNALFDKDLETLDKFTSFFYNEQELKLYLVKEGLLDKTDINKKINVIYKYNGKIKKIPVIFSEMKKIVSSIDLRNIIFNNIKNIEFIEILLNYYSKQVRVGTLQEQYIFDMRLYLNDLKRNSYDPFDSEELINNAIRNLFETTILTKKSKTKPVTENYRKVRDLAIIVYNYEKQRRKNEKNKELDSKVSWEQPTLFDSIYMEESLPLTEKKQNSNGKWLLSSDGEPDFPPNSEEEASYFEYLKHLRTEKSSDIEERKNYRR